MGDHEATCALLRGRSVRTLAWLGDAEFERAVRTRLALRGDHPVDRLDGARARVVRSEAQAALLAVIEADLEAAEVEVVRRGRNASVRAGGRAVRDVKAYRAATGFEALVGWWAAAGPGGWCRFEATVGAALDSALDDALERSRKPRRG